ncbi:MAG: hypothetical protein AB8H03_06555 [Saprospiraceae bacterium]
MNVLDQVRVVVYRINKKGLEIFLVNEEDNWQIPKGSFQQTPASILSEDNLIELEPTQNSNGNMQRALAVEGDWHDIPSIRGIIKDDVRIVKDQLKQRIPGLEQGTFVAVKEAVKRVMPEEYACLKELKEIIVDRNSAKYI